METIIDKKYLREHPNEIFVFGDNLDRTGYGGAAILRDEPNTYGFITKKDPFHEKSSYYMPDEYEKLFYSEVDKLLTIMRQNTDKTYLISKLGAGIANRHLIWEEVIQPKLRKLLEKEPNVRFLYEDTDIEYVYYSYIDQRGKLNIFQTTETSVENKLDIIRESKIALKILPVVKASSMEEAIEMIKLFYK